MLLLLGLRIGLNGLTFSPFWPKNQTLRRCLEFSSLCAKNITNANKKNSFRAKLNPSGLKIGLNGLEFSSAF